MKERSGTRVMCPSTLPTWAVNTCSSTPCNIGNLVKWIITVSSSLWLLLSFAIIKQHSSSSSPKLSSYSLPSAHFFSRCKVPCLRKRRRKKSTQKMKTKLEAWHFSWLVWFQKFLVLKVPQEKNKKKKHWSKSKLCPSHGCFDGTCHSWLLQILMCRRKLPRC